MRRYLGLTALILLLASCGRFPTEVSFTTDPRVLRGTWTGATESVCARNPSVLINSVLNPTGTQFFAISGTALEVFDATNGAKLGGFTVASATLPLVWSEDGASIIQLRTTPTSSIERAVVNPLTGADISAATLATDFIGTNFNYNNDLTRVATFTTSTFSGLSKVDLYDVVTGVLIKSKSVTKINPDTITLNAAGTQMAYTVSNADAIQAWIYDFSADITTKVFERSSATFSITSKPVFAGTNQLNLRYLENINSITKLGIKRINLTDLSNQDTSIANAPNFYAPIQISANGTRFAYVQNDTLFIKNLETSAIITEKPMGSTNGSAYYGTNSSAVLSSNTTGTTWLVTGTRVGCSVRAFETTTQTFTPNAALALDDSQSITMTFVPTYRDSSSYTFTGTVKIGSSAERNIRGSVSVPNNCSLFSNDCEKLTASAPPPPPPYPLSQVHFVNMQYDNGDAFEYPITVVGYTYQYATNAQFKTQFYAGPSSPYSNNPQDKRFLLSPPVTP
jgi:hypothetical protein